MAAGHGGDAVQDYLAEDEIDNLNPALPELLRAWKCEKAAPELLNYEADLVQLVSETLFSQARALEGGSSAHHSVTALFHMDVARTRFLLTSYLRTRLAKVCPLLCERVSTCFWHTDAARANPTPPPPPCTCFSPRFNAGRSIWRTPRK